MCNLLNPDISQRLDRGTGYSHLSLADDLCSSYGKEIGHAQTDDADVPLSAQTTDVLAGNFSARQNCQRSDENCAVECGERETQKAQRRTDECPHSEDGENMQKNVEPWMEICELASRKQDPEKLMELTSELVRLLDEKKNASPSLQLSTAEDKPHAAQA